MKLNRVKFAAVMAQKHWKHKKLSELSGVSPCTISLMANGKRIRKETATKISTALDISLDKLFSYEG